MFYFLIVTHHTHSTVIISSQIQLLESHAFSNFPNTLKKPSCLSVESLKMATKRTVTLELPAGITSMEDYE